MTIVIKIQLLAGLYATSDWSCDIEVEESISLVDLHNEIQRVVNFENDHLYTFFISRRAFGSERTNLDDEEHPVECKLSDLFPLPKNRKLFYWFDFGDDWIFQISKSRKKPKKVNDGLHSSTIISESGNKPEQYPDLDW